MMASPDTMPRYCLIFLSCIVVVVVISTVKVVLWNDNALTGYLQFMFASTANRKVAAIEISAS